MSVSPSGFSDLQGLLRAQMMNKALGQEVEFDRSRVMQLLRVFVVMALFEQILDPTMRKIPALPRMLYYWMKRLVLCLYKSAARRRVSRSALRKARISYITDDHKINDLFEAVEWFINDKLKDEQPSKKDLVIFSRETKSTVVTTGLPEKRSTEIAYEQCVIKACIRSEMIELHADRTYKRKNRIIDLVVEMEGDDARDILGMFVEMCDEKHRRYKKTLDQKPEVHRSRDNGTWEKTSTEIQRRPETVVLRGTIREDIFDDLGQFMMSEDWYRSRDVPYTRRYLFHGKPGTGKTSLIKAIATKYRRSLHFLLLSEVQSDTDLLKLFEAVDFSRTVVVIEDIDCASKVTHVRSSSPVAKKKKKKKHPHEEEKPKPRLTMAGLLNAIDGAMLNVHGQIMVMTTNHPEVLDDALTRAGRIDRKFEFDLCDTQQALDLFANFYGADAAEKKTMPDNWPVTGPQSPADITGVLIQYRVDPEEAWRVLCAK